MNDEKLIIASKSGDSQAFKKLVKRYQNRVSATEIDALHKHRCKLSVDNFPSKIAIDLALRTLQT